MDHFSTVSQYLGANVFGVRTQVPYIDRQLDTQGQLTDPQISQQLDAQVRGFVRFTGQHRVTPAPPPAAGPAASGAA